MYFLLHSAYSWLDLDVMSDLDCYRFPLLTKQAGLLVQHTVMLWLSKQWGTQDLELHVSFVWCMCIVRSFCYNVDVSTHWWLYLQTAFFATLVLFFAVLLLCVLNPMILNKKNTMVFTEDFKTSFFVLVHMYNEPNNVCMACMSQAPQGLFFTRSATVSVTF